MPKLSPALAIAAALALSACTATTPLQTPITEAGQASLLISSFSPTVGGPGTVVTITGAGFDATVPSNNTVQFDGVPGVVQSATATTLVAVVPAGATVGTVTVIVNGKVVSSSDAFAAAMRISTIMGITTPAGVPAASFRGSFRSVAFDAAGNAYVVDSSRYMILKVSPAGMVTTVAGTGSYGHSGDGGPAIRANLYNPEHLVVDKAGNVYFSEYLRVRKVSAVDGTITTVAGVGSGGHSGDGGPASRAQIGEIYALTTDAAGNLYIASRFDNNNRVRKVSADGTITTVAGNGQSGNPAENASAASSPLGIIQGLAVDDAGNLYLADSTYHRVRKVNAEGQIATFAGTGSAGSTGDGLAPTSAQFHGPRGLALDAAGNLYIADYYNQRVRKVSADGSTITTVAGNGQYGTAGDGELAVNAQFRQPMSVSVDAAGNLVVIDESYRLRRVSAADSRISTVAGGDVPRATSGAASAMALGRPRAMAEDAQGNLYVADTDRHVVFKLASDGTATVVAGSDVRGVEGDGGAATSAKLDYPAALAVDEAGNLYIGDAGNKRVRKVSPDGNIVTVVGTGTNGYAGDGGAATAATIGWVAGLAVDKAGNLYLSDTSYHVIRKVTPDGNIQTIAGRGFWGFSGDGGAATNATLDDPMGMAVDADGNLYFADADNARVRKVATDGTITTVAGMGTDWGRSNYRVNGLSRPHAMQTYFDYPVAVALDPAGNLYICDEDLYKIFKVRLADGSISTVAGNGEYGYSGDGGLAVDARFNYPEAVVWSRSGRLIIADTYNQLIRAVGF